MAAPTLPLLEGIIFSQEYREVTITGQTHGIATTGDGQVDLTESTTNINSQVLAPHVRPREPQAEFGPADTA